MSPLEHRAHLIPAFYMCGCHFFFPYCYKQANHKDVQAREDTSSKPPLASFSILFFFLLPLAQGSESQESVHTMD